MGTNMHRRLEVKKKEKVQQLHVTASVFTVGLGKRFNEVMQLNAMGDNVSHRMDGWMKCLTHELLFAATYLFCVCGVTVRTSSNNYLALGDIFKREKYLKQHYVSHCGIVICLHCVTVANLKTHTKVLS